MNTVDQTKMLLSSFAMQLPTLLVCLVAGVLLVLRWKQTSPAAIWGLLGFGLALALCIIIPLVQMVVQQWAIQSGDFASRTSVFAAFGILWSLLRAVTYALLLIAVLAGRTVRPPQPPPTTLPS